MALAGRPALAQTEPSPEPAPPSHPGHASSHVEMAFDITSSGDDPNDYKTAVRVTERLSARTQWFVGVTQHARFEDPDVVIAGGLHHAFGRKRRLLFSGSVAAGPDSDYVAT